MTEKTLSFAFASAVVCHCMFLGASAPLQPGTGTSPQQPWAYHDSRDVERPADRHLLFGPNFKPDTPFSRYLAR
jgi:hypothetical protein